MPGCISRTKPMFVFDEDTEVKAEGNHRYAGRISERWSIGPVPNGGYVLSVGLSALGHSLERPDPLTVTGHFLRPAAPGPVAIWVEPIKRGRTYSTGMARLIQEDREVLRVLATYGTLGTEGGFAYVAGRPPEFKKLVARSPTLQMPEIGQRFEVEADQETMSWVEGKGSGSAEIRARLRFSDGRPPDTRSLALLADALAPPVFNVMGQGWVPTIELTVHMRARPRSQWLNCVFRSRFVFGGHLDEDGELWDETGQLVAQSRQLAGLPRRT
jgi:acyl-CoA thioesterase